MVVSENKAKAELRSETAKHMEGTAEADASDMRMYG